MRRRLDFERNARRTYPDVHGVVIRSGRVRDPEVVYRIAVEVPEYGTRRVTISFYNGPQPVLKSVKADGPTDSFHRYSERDLCLWWAKAPDDLKWQPDEGLGELILIIREHLFLEAYSRETGEWASIELPHRRPAHDDGRAVA